MRRKAPSFKAGIKGATAIAVSGTHVTVVKANVAAKTGLNKSIIDQGWYEFQRQLTYKQQWSGGKVVLGNPINTSRKCSRCNHVAAENRQSQTLFQCQSCDYEDNADLNAAKNILAAGHVVVACGDIRRDAA
jgi:putative transposase